MNTPGTLEIGLAYDRVSRVADIRDRIRTMINLYGRSGREGIENF